MKRFSGFSTRTQYTPIPNVFFSQLLPQISDIAELKVTLHIFWLLYPRKGYLRFVSYRELLSDRSLMDSLKGEEKSPEETIRQALEMAVERGTILYLRLIAGKDGVPEDVYFLNTDSDRRVVARIQNGELSLNGLKTSWRGYSEAEQDEKLDIFTLYEENIGLIGPMIAEELKEAEKLYPEAWIKDAFREAVSLNKRSWRYIARILERWSTEGRSNGTYRRDSKRQTRRNTGNRNTETWSSDKAEEASSEPVCPVCKGARFVHPRLPSGKPDYSRIVPCRCTREEPDEERRKRLQRYSNLGSLTHLTFDNLLPEGKSENPAAQQQFNRAYQAAKAFADEPEGWMVLAGTSGSGKTHLAAAIANQCIENDYPVFYITVPDLLDHLRATFSPNSEIPYDEFFEQVRNAPLLILDDLGAQSGSPWAKEKLDQLLNHRFSNQLPTVIVSIVPIDELEERIRTRLVASDFCQLFILGEEPSTLLILDWAPEFKKEKGMTFETFNRKQVNLPLEQRQNIEQAFRTALEFARQPDGWLVFWGDNGCGKTHLAAAIVNYRYQHKQPAMFVVVPDFLDHLRSTFSPESKISYDQYFESVKSAPLLVLDDFGKQSTTPWAQEKLYQVINYRYNACLPTVITTNCSEDELDDPISSRFADSTICTLFHIAAPNYFSGRPSGKRTSRNDRK